MSDHKTKWTAIKDADKKVLGYKVTDRNTGDLLALATKTGSQFNIERVFNSAESYNGASAFSRMTDLQEALDGFATVAKDAGATRKDAVSAALQRIGMAEDAGLALSAEDEITDMLSETDSDVSDVPTVETDEQ